MDEFNLWKPTLYDDMNCQAPENDDRNLEWTYTENKLFEMTLAEELDLNSADLYEKMVARLPGKAVDQIKKHHEALIADVAKIERGEIALPDYKETELVDVNGEDMIMKDESGATYSFHQRRRRGVPWSEEEHRLFLMGLDEYGKGDWRSISRFYVMSKTPTQVASHAQKYFRRLESPTPLAKRRYSIHDTRIINSTIVESPARCGDPTTMAEELPPFYGPSNHLPTASTLYGYGDSFYGSSN